MRYNKTEANTNCLSVIRLFIDLILFLFISVISSSQISLLRFWSLSQKRIKIRYTEETKWARDVGNGEKIMESEEVLFKSPG